VKLLGYRLFRFWLVPDGLFQLVSQHTFDGDCLASSRIPCRLRKLSKFDPLWSIVFCFGFTFICYTTSLAILRVPRPQHSNLAFRSDNKTPRPLADVVLLKHFFDQLN